MRSTTSHRTEATKQRSASVRSRACVGSATHGRRMPSAATSAGPSATLSTVCPFGMSRTMTVSTCGVRHPHHNGRIEFLFRRVLHGVLRHVEDGTPRAVVSLLELHGLEGNGDILLLPAEKFAANA